MKSILCRAHNLILCDGDQSDLIAVADDFPLSWKYCNLEPKTLKRHKSLEIQDSSDVLVVGATEEQLQLIREHIGTVSADSTPLLEHQIKGAGIVVAKPDSIHFNLRRDRLAPTDPLRPIQRQLSRLAFAIAICLCLIIAGSWWRSTRIEAKISDTIQAQAAAFKNSFPNSRPPASLLRRIRSEHSPILGSETRPSRSSTGICGQSAERTSDFSTCGNAIYDQSDRYQNRRNGPYIPGSPHCVRRCGC